MGKRQETLQQILTDAGYAVGRSALARPSVACRRRATDPTWAGIERVYRRLDGLLSLCPAQPGPWDAELPTVAVELDEEQHFNRYRAMTLESPLYQGSLFPVDDYLSFCRSYEDECLRKASNRGYWATPSTIAQFGPAGAPGDLNPPGAPRWKQRAFYDFLKDLAPVLVDTCVARIAIWDTLDVDGVRMQVKDVLDQHLSSAARALVDLIQRRSGIEVAA